MEKTHAAGDRVSEDRLPPNHFMNPAEVVRDRWLTAAEKRALLAAWASDVHAVPDAPTLRQLDNGAVVSVSDILQALRSLDGTDKEPSARRHVRLFNRRKAPKGRSWFSDDDDDDPPPCPAMIAPRPHGPLTSGEAAEPCFMVAA